MVNIQAWEISKVNIQAWEISKVNIQAWEILKVNIQAWEILKVNIQAWEILKVNIQHRTNIEEKVKENIQKLPYFIVRIKWLRVWSFFKIIHNQ